MAEEIICTLREASRILRRSWWTLRGWVQAGRRRGEFRPVLRENGADYYRLSELQAMNDRPRQRRGVR